MDSFKPAEISRMELGGNDSWKDFWERTSGQKWGKPGQGGDAEAMRLIGERYGGDAGEEYKERLGCKVDGREFSGVPVRERKKMESRGMETSTARTTSPLPAGAGPRSQKAQNEDFFARMGGENAARPEGLAPSQGGKYGGFGGGPAVSASSREGAAGALPGVDDFQKDPVAALSKGFGWFTSTVGKGAKTVNDGWIQPTAQKVRPSATPTCWFVPTLTANHRSQKRTSRPRPASPPPRPPDPSRRAPRAPRTASVASSRTRAPPGRGGQWSRRGGIFGIRLGRRGGKRRVRGRVRAVRLGRRR